MTEVPEHLLARSKAARAKASGGDAGGAPPATPGEQPGQTESPSAAIEPAAAAAVAAPVEAVVVPDPPFVAAAKSRPRIPRFAIPVLASLPVWALIYAGTLTSSGPSDPELQLGQTVYAQCAGCHGTTGGGGTGRNLHEVLLTFPNVEDHIAWVTNGSPEKGTPYGDPDRPGGQRISQQGFGPMPGFGDSLSEEEIKAVVRYERETFGGEEASPSDAADAASADGESEPAGDDAGGTSATDEAESEGGQVGGGGETSQTDGSQGGEKSDASPSGDSSGDQTDADTSQ